MGGCDLELLRAAEQVAAFAGVDRGMGRMLLRLNAASPYAWMEMATELEVDGEPALGEYCAGRAEELGPWVGPLQLRALNFYMGRNEKAAILRTGMRLLAISRNYDSYVFKYYREAGAGLEEVLRRGIPEDAGAGAAWLSYVIGEGGKEEPAAVWAWMEGKGLVSREASSIYTNVLMRWGRVDEAGRTWERYLGRGARREAGNRIFNPKFQRPFVPGPFDWQVGECAGVTIGFEEGGDLRVEFLGERNVDFRHVTQLMPVSGGRWRLRARVKAEGLTTNEGLILRVRDAEAAQRFSFESEQLSGTTGWRDWAFELDVPAATRLLEVGVARRASAKLDNKIHGVAWVSDLKLEARY